MAHKETVVLDCDRCAGKRQPATQTRKFGIDREQFALDLCDDHGRAFDRDMGAWIRIARDITPQVYDSFSATSRELSIDRAAKHVFAPTPSPDPNVVTVQKLPPAYHLWGLTDHAKQRCEERGITQRDALICASDPKVAYPDKETGYWIHRRDGWVAIVNRNTKVVITVMPDSLLDESQQKKREAVSG